MKNIKYRYYNAPIPGGGYVTGFAFHPKKEGVLYCRTDIGGTYRYDPAADSWKCLIRHVGMEDLTESFPIALALEDDYPDRLYVACGDGRAFWNAPVEASVAERGDEVSEESTGNGEDVNGRLCISEDRGESFRYEAIPCYIHGNLNGRGTGRRMLVDGKGDLWFASQRDGLGHRDTEGHWSFKRVAAEKYLTFVWVRPEHENTIVVGTAGISTRKDGVRGQSLYVSYDRGEHFTKMKVPEPEEALGRKYDGYTAERYAVDDKWLYVTLSRSCDPYAGWMGYSCDGGWMVGGRVLRYRLLEDGRISELYEEITPGKKDTMLRHGFGGIQTAASCPGLVAVATLCREGSDGDNAVREKDGSESAEQQGLPGGDVLYLSKDYGEHWEPVLCDLAIGNLHFNAPYMRPECNGGHSLIHWMTDLAINPMDADELWFNTGTGVFRSERLTQEDRSFSDHCRGIEETVHLNLYSPPSGKVQLIDILGDLGGFAFQDLHKPCANSFADDEGNRYITCINADFPDSMPEHFAVAARGNWKGKTKGGVIITKDSGEHFTRLPLPYGITEELDRLCAGIERPNVNPGWVAMGADGKNIVFCVADGIDLWRENIVVTSDEGEHYEKVNIKGMDGNERHLHKMKVFADRVDPAVFYGFGEDSQIYISTDGGRNFVQQISVLPRGIDFGLIDCANKTEIRGNSGYPGEFYMALEKKGLYFLRYDKSGGSLTASTFGGAETVYRMGLGLGSGQTEYIGKPKTIYISGIVKGKYGFYRSEDEGRNWQRINDDDHCFGEVNSLEGDCRIFGRFFIASGSMGVIVGEQE